MRSTADTVGICLAFVDLGDAFHVLVGFGAGWAAAFALAIEKRIEWLFNELISKFFVFGFISRVLWIPKA